MGHERPSHCVGQRCPRIRPGHRHADIRLPEQQRHDGPVAVRQPALLLHPADRLAGDPRARPVPPREQGVADRQLAEQRPQRGGDRRERSLQSDRPLLGRRLQIKLQRASGLECRSWTAASASQAGSAATARPARRCGSSRHRPASARSFSPTSSTSAHAGDAGGARLTSRTAGTGVASRASMSTGWAATRATVRR